MSAKRKFTAVELFNAGLKAKRKHEGFDDGSGWRTTKPSNHIAWRAVADCVNARSIGIRPQKRKEAK